jgi:retinol dehydrogenase-12
MKTALITGGSAGIGKETARALVAQGYQVIIVARDARKGQAVVQQLRAEHPGSVVSFWQTDLSEPDSVTALAQHVREQWAWIDALVLNAGLFTPRLRTSTVGHEFMFATTHLGHFLLTHHLLDLVLAAPAARVVVTSSVAHFFAAGLNLAGLQKPSTSTFLLAAPFRAYGLSKLANLLFVRELARKLRDTNVLVNAFHPGSVKSEIWRSTPPLFNALIGPTLVTEREGADTQIFLATSPELKQTGMHWFKRQVQSGSPSSRSLDKAKALWTYSEQALGIRAFGKSALARRTPTPRDMANEGRSTQFG